MTGIRAIRRIGVATLLRGGAAASATLAAAASLALATASFAGGEWPDGPNKAWFKNLQRPDNAANPQRDEKSRFCCDIADTVKAKFKV
jgi:hypothetical protein